MKAQRRRIGTILLYGLFTFIVSACARQEETIQPLSSDGIRGVIGGAWSSYAPTGALLSSSSGFYDANCTATLVCPNVVITAGHCKGNSHFTLATGNPGGLRRLPSLPSDSAALAEKRESPRVARLNDTIALQKLSRNMPAGTFATLSALPLETAPPATVRVVGYGNFSLGPSTSTMFYGGKLEGTMVVSKVSDDVIDVKPGAGGTMGAPGDSGGPYLDGGGNLVGIHRGGTAGSPLGTELRADGLHVKAHLDWIYNTMGELCSGQRLTLSASVSNPAAGSVEVTDDVSQNRIKCGNVCTDTYTTTPQKTFINITATAVANPGFVFEKWEGYCAGVNSERCAFGLNRSTSIRAVFRENRTALTIQNPSDTSQMISVVSVNTMSPCLAPARGSCTVMVPVGQAVSLVFSSVPTPPFPAGCRSLSANTCSLTISGPITVSLGSTGPNDSALLAQLTISAGRTLTAEERQSYLPLLRDNSVPVEILREMVRLGVFVLTPCSNSFAQGLVVTSSPVYRLYYPPTDRHHFTSSLGERNALLASRVWRDEQVGFSIAARASASLPAAPQARVYGKCWRGNSVAETNRLLGKTILAASIDASQVVRAGATYLPIHRLYSSVLQRHYLTTNAITALNKVRHPTEKWTLEQMPGVEGYLVQGGAKVFALDNRVTANRLYTDSQATADAVVRAFPGIWVKGADLN